MASENGARKAARRARRQQDADIVLYTRSACHNKYFQPVSDFPASPDCCVTLADSLKDVGKPGGNTADMVLLLSAQRLRLTGM